MMVLTWEGPRKPSTRAWPCSRTSGESRMLWMADGVSTWLQYTLKFSRPRRSASRITSAEGGVVVSKPMPKNTTCRFGCRCAICKASSAD